MTVEEAKARIQYMESRPPYLPWIHTVSALGNEFGEKIALEILLSRFKDEKPGEHLKKLQCRMRNIGIGTFIKMTNEAGYKKESKQLTRYKQTKQTLKSKNPEHILSVKLDKIIPVKRFADYEAEERCAIMEYDGQLSRKKAENIFITQFPEILRERVFRFAVNRLVVDKNVNPKTNKPYNSFSFLTNGFQNNTGNSFELAEIIGAGHPVIFGHLNQGKDGKIRRNNSNWFFSELIALDIDNSKMIQTSSVKTKKVCDNENYLSIENVLQMPLTKKALMLYTTCNHSANMHRFRLVFPMNFKIEKQRDFKAVAKLLITEYHADEQCIDPSRAYYGNRNAIIYLIQEKIMIKYESGNLVEYSQLNEASSGFDIKRNTFAKNQKTSIQNVEESIGVYHE